MLRRTVLVVCLCAGMGCGGGSGSTPSSPTPAPAASGLRTGPWSGTLPSAPAGSGTLSFRVASATSLTIESTRVPTFANMSGCSSSWSQAVAIDGSRAFSATLTSGTTSISISGRFDSDTQATGTIAGTCSGSLLLLGQTFRASPQ